MPTAADLTDNCFIGNVHPNPVAGVTNNISVHTGGWADVRGSWWGSPAGPLIDSPATTGQDSLRGPDQFGYSPYRTAAPTRCDRLPAVTPTPTPSTCTRQGFCPIPTPTAMVQIPYKINIIGDGSRQWSTLELSAIDIGIRNVGSAFNHVATTTIFSASAFNLAMLENSGTEVLFIRTQQQGSATVNINNYHYLYGSSAGQTANFSYPSVTQGYCKAFQEGLVNQVIRPAAIICNGDLIDQYNGTTLTLQASEFTIIHELGHIFDYRISNGLSNPIDGGFTLLDCDRNIVMGNFINGWTRGRRGWGTGPAQYRTLSGNVAPLVTDFQQNTENSPVEAAAESFLNWVYRKIASGGGAAVNTCTSRPAWDHWNGLGYRNVEWSATPHPGFIADSRGIPGTSDASLPGDIRYFDMDTRIQNIFSTRGW